MKKRPAVSYAAASGGCLTHTQARAAGTVMAQIEQEEGCVTPSSLLAVSRPEAAPCHNLYTWDDTLAGEKWRLEESRRIIRSVCIVNPAIPQAEQIIRRAFVNIVPCDTETRFTRQAYISFANAEKNPAYVQQLLANAKQELRLWQQKYEDLREYFTATLAGIEKDGVS